MLKHYRKREVLRLIDMMEECFNQPFTFDPELLEARRGRTGSATEPGHWGYGINIYGKARRYCSKSGEAPTLNSTMYGFSSNEEYFRVQAYLKTHGGFQLEVVSIGVWKGNHPLGSCLLLFYVYLRGCLVQLLYFSHFAYDFSFYFQVDGNGNCMFSAIKMSLGVRHKEQQDHRYYPMRYFHQQVVVWLVQNRQHVWLNKHVALEANYDLEEQMLTLKGPLTYKSYCHHLLQRAFWGDKLFYTLFLPSGGAHHSTKLQNGPGIHSPQCHNGQG